MILFYTSFIKVKNLKVIYSYKNIDEFIQKGE